MPFSTDELAIALINTLVVVEQRNLIAGYMGKFDGAGGYDFDVGDGQKWVRTGSGESAAPLRAWNNLGAANDETIAVWVTMAPEGKLIILDYRREA